TEGDNDADATTHQVASVAAPQQGLNTAQQAEVRAAMPRIAACKTVEALTALKVELPDYVKNDRQFIEAGKMRYAEIMKDKEPAKARHPNSGSSVECYGLSHADQAFESQMMHNGF